MFKYLLYYSHLQQNVGQANTSRNSKNCFAELNDEVHVLQKK